MHRRLLLLVGGSAVIGAGVLWFLTRPPETTVVDLVSGYAVARHQPSDASFQMTDVTIGGDTRPSIAANGSTRLTYHVTVPNHARLRVALGLTPETGTEPANGVLFLIGVSDGHSYQTLRSITLAPYSQPRDRRWQDVSVSLEEYADLTVDLVLNTRAGAAADGVTVRGA